MSDKRPSPAQDRLNAIGSAEIAHIYGLYDANGRLRYVGKAKDPHSRLVGHMRASKTRKTRKTPLYDWIRKHGQPELRVVEANCKNWQEAERRHIREAREAGLPLLNVADGGDEPFCPKNVRSAHGRRLNAAGPMAFNDPFAYARREFLRRLGTLGAVSLREAALKIDGELLAYRLSRTPWGIKMFPPWCRQELLKDLA